MLRLFAFLPLLLLCALPSSALAAETCFGREVSRVVRSDTTAGYGEVVLAKGNIEIRSKAYSVICADGGDQTIWAGRGSSLIRTGSGADTVHLHSASGRNRVWLGDGDDRLWGSRGSDLVRSGAGQDLVVSRGGNDRIWNTGGTGNKILAGSGSDRVWSLGGQSFVWGGNGTDFLYSNGGKGALRERLFGERGNDRLLADYGDSEGSALLDPGPGDDWIRGTSFADTIIFQSGIKKISARDGDDLLLASGLGRATVWGGGGNDTVSFAAWTPADEGGYRDGLWIRDNRVRALRLEGWENIRGSAFDDFIESKAGQRQTIWGGMGDDDLRGQEEDGDAVWGGSGRNDCQGFQITGQCEEDAPLQSNQLHVDLDESGVLVARSGSASDDIRVEKSEEGYRILSAHEIEPSGLCNLVEGGALCSGEVHSIIVYGGGGDDQITVGGSVPATLTTTLDGGSGVNMIQGGQSKDTIRTKEGLSAGSRLRGGGGVDNIYLRDDLLADGQGGNDVLHVKNPCLGGLAVGSLGRDNLVFAGAKKGVWASIGKGRATWRSGTCALPLRIDSSLEGLEGTAHNDYLVLGRRFPEQEGPGKLLGREGEDILDARNGYRDTVTTGSGGRKNRVLRDKGDIVIWGWGLSGY